MAESVNNTDNQPTFEVSDSGLHINNTEHVIDFDKVTTLEDVISILKGMNITIWGDIDGSEYDDIRHLLKEA